MRTDAFESDLAHARHDAHIRDDVGTIGTSTPTLLMGNSPAMTYGRHTCCGRAWRIEQRADFVLGRVDPSVVGGPASAFFRSADEVRCSVRATSLGLLRWR